MASFYISLQDDRANSTEPPDHDHSAEPPGDTVAGFLRTPSPEPRLSIEPITPDQGPSPKRGRRCDVSFGEVAEEDAPDENHDALRICVSADRFTRDEIWACLLAVKIRHALPEKCLETLGTLLNAMASDSVTESLPDTRHRVVRDVRKLLPINPRYVSFCPACKIVCDESVARIAESSCHECEKDLASDLRTGNAMFLKFSVREQLQLYFGEPALGRLIGAYENHLLRVLQGIQPYDSIIRSGDLCLSLYVDSAPVRVRTGASFCLSNVDSNSIFFLFEGGKFFECQVRVCFLHQ